MGDQINSQSAMTQPSGDSRKDQYASQLRTSNSRAHCSRPPFYSQLDDVSQSRVKTSQQAGGNIESQPFDFRQMANALPATSEQSAYGARRPSAQYNTPASAGMMAPSSYAYGQPVPQYIQQPHDPRAFARLQQQQQYPPQQVMPQAAQYAYPNRPQQQTMQMHPQYARVDNFAYGINQPGYSPVDMRFPQSQFPMGYAAPGGHADIGNARSHGRENAPANALHLAHYARRPSEPVSIPSFPRGPPRKPKQSGHALWVGNLPPAATVTDLKDHFSRDATNDIQSLFLISKSNCAFVNYCTEAACIAAMNRFHDSRFHGVRLVCRLRRGSTTSTPTTTTSEEAKANSDLSSVSKPLTDGVGADEPSNPIIVGGPPAEKSGQTTTKPAQAASPATRVPEKFFVVKSLTLQDLEASVRNGIWATQSHNETTLNEAFGAADNVYLIFSANKSGEYFGYARMASPITGEAVPVGSAPVPQISTPSDGPQSIPTPATETAPRGRIIDDSARGTIFWEAELSDEEEASSPTKESEDSNSGQDLGRPFNIEWISTARLPFYRTRGLRNPWNANREVKIARDGTELEPSVGKRLVQMFHRPVQMGAPPIPMQAQAGMPYQMA